MALIAPHLTGSQKEQIVKWLDRLTPCEFSLLYCVLLFVREDLAIDDVVGIGDFLKTLPELPGFILRDRADDFYDDIFNEGGCVR